MPILPILFYFFKIVLAIPSKLLFHMNINQLVNFHSHVSTETTKTIMSYMGLAFNFCVNGLKLIFLQQCDFNISFMAIDRDTL